MGSNAGRLYFFFIDELYTNVHVYRRGNLEQRAARLFSTKNKKWDDIDAKIKATVSGKKEN